MKSRSLLTVAFLACFLACGDKQQKSEASTPDPDTTPDASEPSGPLPVEIELVESWPAGTTLDHDDIRDAVNVWPEMIDRAQTSVDFGEFYASADDEAETTPESLEPSLLAIERAVARGVKVRFLADWSFSKTYPDTLKRLKSLGADVRKIDFGDLAGGILHAKYFIVDRKESFVGSQNFDWRALTQIQELGVRVQSEDVGGALEDVFETDWALAVTDPDKKARVHNEHPSSVTAVTGEKLTLLGSPKKWLPDEETWDLPRLVSMIEGAKKSVFVQVLSYSAMNLAGTDETAFTTLDDALRGAADRGVKVRLLVSHWNLEAGSGKRTALEALQKVPNVEVSVLTPPAKPDIPYARVIHAKYAVVDGGDSAWVGTSNWEGEYFLSSRNVGFLIEGGKLPGRLESFFESNWESSYTKELAPLPPADL